MGGSRPPEPLGRNEPAPGPGEMPVAAFDPGRNIGFAVVGPDGEARRLGVLNREEVATVAVPPDAVVLVGAGTGHHEVLEALRGRGLEPRLVDERGSSLEGLDLWRRHERPRGWARLLPRSLRTPARPIDGYAAWAIALHYLGRRR